MKDEIAQFKRYLQHRCPGRSTTKHYMSDLAIFNEFVGDVAPKLVMSQDIDRFVQDQSQQGLQAATFNRRLSTLSSFFDYLIDSQPDDSWTNPVNWKRHSIRPGHHLPRDVSDETVERLFAAIEDSRDRAIFSLMLKAGLRVGEIVDLQLTDLDLGAPTPLVRLRVRGKGDKERVVWLTADVMQQVECWLNERPQADRPYLFLNQHGRSLSVSGVQFRLKQYCLQAGVQLSCHQLRHTFARRLVEHKIPIDSLAKLLGHNDLQTTQRYIDGADPMVRRDFLEAMDQLNQGAAKPPTADEPRTHFPASAPSGAERRPEPADLVDELTHLAADLPDWLQAQLRQHTIRRAVRWPTHRLKIQLQSHFSTLCRISRWLVVERQWDHLANLKRTDLVAYVNAQAEAGLKPRSIASKLTVFRIFWRDLLNQELVTNGAVLLAKAPPAGDHLPRYLTGAEFQRLEQVVQAETQADRPQDRFNRAWFYLLAHAGLRHAELLNLRLSDCDLSGRRLRVQSGKGDRDRVIPMTEQLIHVLQDYLAVRELAPTDHLLIYKGAALKPFLIPDRLARFGHKAQIDPMTSHRLRHTLATFLVNHGMPITSLQKFLGHQDINKTLIYARVHDETVRQQFAAAMAQIECIAVADWPVDSQPLTQPIPISVGQICDSV
ncbi:MAG TPA: tyrosine-type recombinase/integrase [Anaerolineae bacterium]|nr:tyrosine-type recombinase/integrase [Anaerolineae bacterium]